MTKNEIKFRDPVVERVVDKFISRSDVGYKKYVKEHLKHVTLYKPQNQKDCDEVIKLILNKIK